MKFADGQIDCTIENGIAWVTLDRPEKRNAITGAMWRAMPELTDMLAENDAVRSVVLRGAGNKAFAAGAAIEEFSDNYESAESARVYNDNFRAGELAFAGLLKPVVAMIHGACVGGGCELAMVCDQRFASSGSKYGVPPAKLGTAVSFGDTKQLVDLVGHAKARDLLFTGRLIDAEEALAIGLINRIYPEDELEEAVRAYCEELGQVSQNSIAVAKQMIAAVVAGADPDEPAYRKLFDDTFVSDDFKEGYSAFLEKRKPNFR
jgi:enoyl-CoA hydratase/carnithine racemase